MCVCVCVSVCVCVCLCVIVCVCVCIKCLKSAKKHVKNVKLKLLMVKKIIDDPKKQKCGQELIPNARFQR